MALVDDVPARTVPLVDCLGVPIAAHTPESAAGEIVRLAQHHRDTRSAPDSGGSDVHLCNAHTLALADRDVAGLFAERIEAAEAVAGQVEGDALGGGVEAARRLAFGVARHAGVGVLGGTLGEEIGAHRLEHGNK